MPPRHAIFTIPNLLTGYRFAVAPVLMFFIYPQPSVGVSLVAFFLFLTGALTDLADGYYARKHKIETVLGKLMDPVADKVLVCAALIMLIPMGQIPAWLVFIILSRELVITGLRGVAASSGIVVAASGMGKLKSIMQYTALCILIFPLGVVPIPFLHELGKAILYVSAVMTVWSGVDYFYRFQKIFLGSGS
ncbi:MAG TPA: CDP-diacylglycerol--glycerol-3-phosphate 3-phosphatidyltransferase [Desulfobulbaceae bacterium]|nr:MAG: CDP-diacylglycerol--glycerol-3-phosphate 3-phosphatidyltransferase [Deltaproteobacteria bacterium RIFOXYD12_FULL_53_23]HCC53424.1 CDP-diacylglycerol--glycerol-3-phosphate 3-phosphatidyltransferase [Desulfobulbaceae bacterium]